MDNNVQNIRVFYNKKARAKYISHLDITRCMQRALKRSTLPVWYTEGFNPHIYITFALPLSLGYESESESMDMRLTETVPFDEVMDRLNQALPQDIRVTAVALQKNKPEVITTALYEISLSSETLPPQTIMDCINNMFNEEKIEVVKRTKKGNKLIDIKPDINLISSEVTESCVNLTLKTVAGITKNINPTLLTDEMSGKYSIDDLQVDVLRKAVLKADETPFE